MKINPNDPVSRILESNTKINKVSSSGKAEPAAGKAVEISSLASELSNIQDELNKIPDIRQGRVDELKKQIDSGDYKIDDDRLSDVLSKFI